MPSYPLVDGRCVGLLPVIDGGLNLSPSVEGVDDFPLVIGRFKNVELPMGDGVRPISPRLGGGVILITPFGVILSAPVGRYPLIKFSGTLEVTGANPMQLHSVKSKLKF